MNHKHTTSSAQPCVSPRAHRRLRRWTIALAIVIALPIAVILAVVFGYARFLRTQVENLTSAALKVPVVMDRARVNVTGVVRFDRIAVGNPLPFKEIRAFRVDAVAAEMSLASIFKDTIEVNEVVILHPRMIVEVGKERINWSVIMDRLKKPAAKPEAEEAKQEVKRGEKKFIVRKLRIVRPVVVIRGTNVSNGGVEITLRDIDLEGIGTGPESAAPLSLVLATVFQSILTGAISQWGDIPGTLRMGEITAGTSKAYGDRLKTGE